MQFATPLQCAVAATKHHISTALATTPRNAITQRGVVNVIMDWWENEQLNDDMAAQAAALVLLGVRQVYQAITHARGGR